MTEQQLADVARDVLETMAFAFVASELDEAVPAGSGLCAEVTFRGPLDGTLSLAMPVVALDELAGNMLAVADGEPCTEQQRRDALGEMANVICGNVLAAAAGPEAAFDLAPPRVVEDREAAGPSAVRDEADGEAPRLSARVPLENGWALAVLTLAAAGHDS